MEKLLNINPNERILRDEILNSSYKSRGRTHFLSLNESIMKTMNLNEKKNNRRNLKEMLKRQIWKKHYKMRIQYQSMINNFNLWKTKFNNHRIIHKKINENVEIKEKKKTDLRSLLEEANSYIFSFNNKKIGIHKKEIICYANYSKEADPFMNTSKLFHAKNGQRHSLSIYDNFLSTKQKENNCKAIKKIIAVPALKNLIKETKQTIVEEKKNKHKKRQAQCDHLYTEHKISEMKKQFLYNISPVYNKERINSIIGRNFNGMSTFHSSFSSMNFFDLNSLQNLENKPRINIILI